MKTTTELLEQRGILDKEFTDLANLGDKLTPENEARMDAIIAELSTLNETINKTEKREAAQREVEARGKVQLPTFIKSPKTDNEEQVKNAFSIRKMIYDVAMNGATEGLEKEITSQGDKEARASGLTPEGLSIPAFIIGNDKRAAVNTTSTADTPKTGYYVATDTLTDRWIDVLRNKLVLTQAGAQLWEGMEGNVSIPKKTTAATVAWLSETGAITPNNSVNAAITMAPKRVGGAIPFTKTLLRQTSLNVENFIREDLASGIAQALQAGALYGAGSSNEPTGISTALTTTGGTNVIAMGTNGLAPTWASIVELQKQVAMVNADMGKMAYLFNAATRGKMKTVVRDAGSGLFLWDDDGNVNGERTFVTNAVRSNLTKGSSSGVCSEAYFGNWEDLIIASWGGLDIVVDPYSLSLSNQIQIGVNGYYDIGIQREASFAIIKDYLTA